MQVKHESVFIELAGRDAAGVVPTDHGRAQFVAYDGRGHAPGEPDPYYLVLRRGKDALDNTIRLLRHAFDPDRYPASSADAQVSDQLAAEGVVGGGWEGWAVYFLRYSPAARRLLFAWHQDPPPWFYFDQDDLLYDYLRTLEALQCFTSSSPTTGRSSRPGSR